MAINKYLKQFTNQKKGNKLFNSWLYCRWVLYLLFILAIGNIYYLLVNYDYFTLAIFVLVAFLTTFFSKNMVVILCISLVISTIFKSVRIAEGYEGGLTKKDKESFDYIMEKLSNFREDYQNENDANANAAATDNTNANTSNVATDNTNANANANANTGNATATDNTNANTNVNTNDNTTNPNKKNNNNNNENQNN